MPLRKPRNDPAGFHALVDGLMARHEQAITARIDAARGDLSLLTSAHRALTARVQLIMSWPAQIASPITCGTCAVPFAPEPGLFSAIETHVSTIHPGALAAVHREAMHGWHQDGAGLWCPDSAASPEGDDAA